MEDNLKLIIRAMRVMSPNKRHQIRRLIDLASERDACVLSIIRRIESGSASPKDALDALETYLQSSH